MWELLGQHKTVHPTTRFMTQAGAALWRLCAAVHKLCLKYQMRARAGLLKAEKG